MGTDKHSDKGSDKGSDKNGDENGDETGDKRREMNGGERAFSFLPVNPRQGKPRDRGMTEMRGPYYHSIGKRRLLDIFETCGEYVDILKFSGGAFKLMPERTVREQIETCHAHDVRVSTGGSSRRCCSGARKKSATISTSARSCASTSSRFPAVFLPFRPMTSFG
jgi:hypothetical protein